MIVTTRHLSGLFAAAILASGTMAVVSAGSALPSPPPAATAANTLTHDALGRPILLARMVVTATALE